MVDNTQAQYESNSPQNKPPLPGQTYGQTTVYAAVKNNGPNVSDSGKANPPPQPVLGPQVKITSHEYTPSEQAQYYSIHPELKPMADLADVTAVKGNEAVYNYTKNLKSQPSQMADVLTLSKSTAIEPPGLVDIYANTETKNGITTTTTIVPSISNKGNEIATASLYGKTFKTFIPTKEEQTGEISSFFKFPFVGHKAQGGEISPTSLADLSILVPGFGGGELAKGAESALKGVSKLAGKDVSSITSKISPAFKENTLEVRSEKVGSTVHLTQGTEQEITLTTLKPEKAPLQIERGEYAEGGVFKPTSKTVSSKINIGGGKFVTVEENIPTGKIVKVTQPELPKGITETKRVEGISKVGERIVPHEPTSEEISNRYPLFGKGKNDLSDLTKTELPKEIPTTEQKPVFGVVSKEVPNLIDITKQSAKSGQSELAEAFVSEKQVAFTRSPSGLEENKIIITGKPSQEIISTFGLQRIQGTKNVWMSADLTKGMKEYLKGAEKAGLITQRLSETHIQSAKDILTNPKLYVQASREPDLFEKFTEVVRPQVIGTREAYPMKTQILKKSSGELRSFKKMQPFGPIKESKGVAGSAGKAKALLEQKPEQKGLNKPELFKTQKESKLDFSHPFSRTTGSVTLETLRYPKGTEDKFSQSFRSVNDIISTTQRTNKSITIMTEKLEEGQNVRSSQAFDLLQKNISDILTAQKQNQETISTLVNKNEFVTRQESGLISKQNTDQVTDLITKQTTTTTDITKQPPPTKTTIGGPPDIPFLEEKKRYKKPKSRTAKQVNFLGNAPVSDVIGLTRRADITYGNKITAKLVSKDIRKYSHGKFESNPIEKSVKKEQKPFNLYQKLSVNKTIKLRSERISTKKSKNEFTNKKQESIYKKLRL